MNLLKRLTFALVLLGCTLVIVLSGESMAQTKSPDLPDMPLPIADLANKGAQVRYLGRDLGYDGWLVIMQGVEQYFYNYPGEDGIILGMMFDSDGKMITVRQVANLLKKEPELDMFAGEDDGVPAIPEQQ